MNAVPGGRKQLCMLTKERNLSEPKGESANYCKGSVLATSELLQDYQELLTG